MQIFFVHIVCAMNTDSSQLVRHEFTFGLCPEISFSLATLKPRLHFTRELLARSLIESSNHAFRNEI